MAIEPGHWEPQPERKPLRWASFLPFTIGAGVALSIIGVMELFGL